MTGVRLGRRDWALAGVAGLVGLAGSLALAQHLPDRFDYSYDVFFNADTARVFSVMTEGRGARAGPHPLFALLTYPPTAALVAAGLSPHAAARGVVALAAAANGATFFLLVRLLGWGALHAFAFVALFFASTGSIFFFSTVETCVFGSLALLLPALLVALRPEPPWRLLLWVAAGLLGIGVTLTHFVAPLTGVALTLRWRPVLRWAGVTLALAAAAMAAQTLLLPGYRPTHGVRLPAVGELPLPNARTERMFLGAPSPRSAATALANSLAAPVVRSERYCGWNAFTITPRRSAASAGIVAAWLALAAVGAVSGIRRRSTRAVALSLALPLLAHCGLHSVYGVRGWTLFVDGWSYGDVLPHLVFSLQFAPLMAGLAALPAPERLRTAQLGLAVLVALAAGVHNYATFARTAARIGESEVVRLEHVTLRDREGSPILCLDARY